MMSMVLHFLFLFPSANAVTPVGAGKAMIEPITLTSEDKLPTPRWMYGDGEAPKGNQVTALMAAARQAQLNGDFETCARKAESAFGKAPVVQRWIILTELECASKIGSATPPQQPEKQHDKIRAELLQKIIARVDKNPAWLASGPAAAQLRAALIRSLFVALESDVKLNRQRAERSIERLQEFYSALDEKSRARLWRLAGEIAFLNQKSQAAREFLKRSLNESDLPETRSRLQQVDATFVAAEAKNEKVSAPLSTALEARPSSAALESTREELELVERVTAGLKSGELVSAVDDAIKIIVNYPGGTRAKWAAERVTEAYFTIAEKSDPKFALSRAQLVRLMERADGDRLAEWARLMFNRGQWEDSLTLGRKALESLEGARSTSTLDTAAKAAVATDKFDIARDLFERLVREHAGTSQAKEALFRLGLLHFRQGRFEQASAEFERLLTFPALGAFETQGTYWLWRSLQQAKSPRADQVADDLIKRVPFSYYGLRARLDRTNQQLDWRVEPAKLTTQLWLTAFEKKAWESAQLLLKAGWLDEAQSELKELPPATLADDKAIRALLWAAAGQYVNASRLANEAWDEVPNLRRPPFVNVAFPKEFNSYIESHAGARKLDQYLVRGLIKQESGFNPRALSSSNAQGLMQIIPPTAREIAQELKLGTLVLPDDLFQSARNIQMGTYYLSRLMARYQGHVPLALASYNAGPTRIDRWLRARPSLKNLSASRSSKPEDEIWFDEMPYAETSGYVKAILRNILIYKMLDQGRVQIIEPIWAFDANAPSASTAPRPDDSVKSP